MPLTDFEAITNYNNYYEFSTDKEGVAPRSKDFKTRRGRWRWAGW